MDYNLQQSSLQVPPVNKNKIRALANRGHSDNNLQSLFASPRRLSNPLVVHQPSTTPDQMNTSHYSNFKSPEVINLKQQKSPKTYKLAQIKGSVDHQINASQISSTVSPPNLPATGKVKKIKVNKLNAEQLSQIRANPEHRKTGSTSLPLTMPSTPSAPPVIVQSQQIISQNGRDPTQYVTMGVQQQNNLIEQHSLKISPSGPTTSYLKPVRRTIQPLSEDGIQPQKFQEDNLSGQLNYGQSTGNQSPAHQLEADSKLGRKGERPTVAQILEIGSTPTSHQQKQATGQSWMEKERHMPQQLSRLTLNSVPAYNATITSNFDSLGRNTLSGPNTDPQNRQPKFLKGVSMDDRQSQLRAGQAQQHQALPLPHFRRINKSKNRKFEDQVSSGAHIQSQTLEMSTSRVSDQILNNTTAAATYSRNEGNKIHYSEGARHPSTISCPQDYSNQSPQQAYIPLLLDVNNNRASSQVTGAQHQQLFSRLQQQFLQQATIIRHPQIGELPVIQMSQQQLNQMMQQAAQQRNNFQQEQQPEQVSEGSGNNPATFSMSQMLTQQGLPTNTQIAFAIQLQDLPAQQNSKPPHQYFQQQQPQHCQFPSLNQPNNMQNLQQQHSHPQGLSQHHQFVSQYQLVSPAPVKKMTLNSRRKSVPSGAVQIEGDSSGLPVASARQQQQYQQQQQQQQHYHNQHEFVSYSPSGASSSNRIGGVNFFQNNGQQMQHMTNKASNPDRSRSFQVMQSGQAQQPPLLAPLKEKGHRKSSMELSQSPRDSANQKQRDNSQQSARNKPAAQNQYGKLSSNLSSERSRNNGGQSRLNTGSGRLSNQGGHQSQTLQTAGGSNVYVTYKGPLSDLITTQQSNLNQPVVQSSIASGSRLRISKPRQMNSSITVNSTSRSGEPPETSSQQDMNGGVPQIFLSSNGLNIMKQRERSKFDPHRLQQFVQYDADQNQKIDLQNKIEKSPAFSNQEELKAVKQQLERAGSGCPNIIIGELKDIDSQSHHQADFTAQPEPKTKKKGKTRKIGFNSSQNQKIYSKSQVEAVRFGQRHVSQQPHQQPLPMQHIMQDQRMLSKDKKKKLNQNMMSANQTLTQSHPESSYHDQQQQMLQYQEESYHQHQMSITPPNLKPNIQLKCQIRKGNENNNAVFAASAQQNLVAEGTQGSSEPSLAQHGIFAKALVPACTKYYKSKNNTRMTPYKYKNGISNRLLVAKETFAAKRMKLPIMVINIDGVLGYFDEQKNYNCREKTLHAMQSLSHNYKIVGFSAESKGIIQRFGRYLSEHTKFPFAFDAIYQIQRKPVQNQNRVNLTQVILDFSGEDEEDLDLFVSSQIVLVTIDKNKLSEKFETMDLREVFDYDKEYLRGAKAPLIVRIPHARCRPLSSLTFEMLFQLMTCLLVSSKLSNLETTSLFTYNDRTKGLSIPTSDKGIVSSLLPERMKVIEKSIQTSKSLRFIMNEPPHGLNLHKGFKQLTEVYRGANKPDWLDFNYRVFKPLLPIRMRLQKITQLALQGAQPPTGKKLIVRCETEDATRKYQLFCKKNEAIRKQIRKYRARYWAVNQIEDTNLEEEHQDIVGDLLNDALVATTFCDVVHEESNSPDPSPEKQQSIDEPGDDPSKTEDAPAEPVAEGTAESQLQVPPDVGEVKAEGEKLGGGACSSSSEDEDDSDNEHYDEQAQAVKFKVIDIKHVVETSSEGVAAFKRQATLKPVEKTVLGNKQQGVVNYQLVKIECRKIQKPKSQFLVEFFSKKQNSMMFTTNQAQHLQGAAALQIENQISELVQKLNEADKAGKKEIFNYDF